MKETPADRRRREARRDESKHRSTPAGWHEGKARDKEKARKRRKRRSQKDGDALTDEARETGENVRWMIERGIIE